MKNVKKGQKLMNAANFQSVAFREIQGRDKSKLVKILPKMDPLLKVRNKSINDSLSPVRETRKVIPDNLMHSQNKTYSYEISACIENKKLENLETFFAEKIKRVSKKMQILRKSPNLDTSPNEKIDKLSNSEIIQEEPHEYVSRIKKDLMQTELEVQLELDNEEIKGKPKESTQIIEIKKKKTENLPYMKKFIVLNKRAVNVLASVGSDSGFDISRFRENSSHIKEDIKLPIIRKKKFYDPTPVPSNFQMSKEMIIPEY